MGLSGNGEDDDAASSGNRMGSAWIVGLGTSTSVSSVMVEMVDSAMDHVVFALLMDL